MKLFYKPLLSFSIIFFCLLFQSQLVFGQCGCNHIISLNATEYIFDGAKKGVKPGDKICFTSGTRTGIGFVNIKGTAEKPVIITNMCDGKVVLNAPLNWGNAVEFNSSSHFRLTGSGNPNEEFGIEIKGAQMGLNIHGLSTNFEIDHLNVNNVGCVGITAKTDPTCDQATWRGNFTLRDSKFHHNKISDTGCEGFYIGNSHYDNTLSKTCNSQTIKVSEHDLINIEVYNNELRNIGNDGIQVGGTKNASIHHNYVYNVGLKNNEQHQNLIQTGNGTQATVYNNIIDTGKGYGIFDSGGGGIYYNNIVMNAQLGGMILQDIAPNFAPTGFYVVNNTFINCRDYGVLMFSENLNTTYYINNIVVGQNQSNYKYVNFNNASKNKWVESNNLRTQDISTVKFKNPSAKDFHLEAGSPAVDAGKDVSSYGVTTDFDKVPRPNGGSFDIGAFEFQGNNPTSNAGPDKTINLPTNTVILNGSGFSPTGTINAYLWTLKSGSAATLTNETSANLTVTDLVEGVYTFQLQVTDASASAFDEVVVTVLPAAVNQNPTAKAGTDKTITLPANTLTITGSGSDPDGSIVKYTWTKISGPAVDLANENTAVLGLTNLLEGVYEFQLTVEDDAGATASDVVKVTVNAADTNIPPTVNAGVDKDLFLPANSIVINGTATDEDGTIATILWEKRSGPVAALVNANTLNLTANNLIEGIYNFRLTVTDNSGASKFDEVKVTVLQGNQNPTANAGSNKSITLPTSTINLTGTGSDADGTIASYAWIQVSGPATATLVNANLPQVTISDLVAGVYVFGFTVEDNNGAADYDEVSVTVLAAGVNQPPTAKAGPDKIISLPINSTVLNGSGTDTDGTITVYKWTQKSGPPATLVNDNTKDLTLNDLVAGSYVFTLSVTDDDGETDDDNVLVNVLPASINQSPVANSGGNRYLTLPSNAVSLIGAGVDPDGTIASYAWTKEQGPAATLNGENTATLNVSNLIQGEYQFKLTVTDNSGATASDFATVIVSSGNLSPLVNAGENKVIVLPQNAVSLTGTASDPDGTIATYLWGQVSGPVTTLSGQNTATLSLTDLAQGTYVFTLTVTDNNGASSLDEVIVSVLAASSNLPPVVDAGIDQIIFLPTNSLVLSGNATDIDGTIATFLWTKRSGPVVTLINDNTSSLTVTGLTEGVYILRLTVTDNNGTVAFDEVTVTVKASTQNQPPVVNAGANQIIQLPTNSIQLQGSATDNDGTISSYAWSKISGPTASLQNASTSNLSVNNLLEGTYVFRLTVHDNGGASGFSEVRVIVFPATLNQSPIANAGQNQTIILPTDNTSLVGSGFDPDGTITNYAWSKVSGPGSFTIVSATNKITSITGLVEGTYVFRLTVTDNTGTKGSDDVSVSVNSSSNNSQPMADAGGNQVIQLPTSSINLFGSGSDVDGSITSYQWTKTSGGTVTLVNATSPTLTITNLQAGVYTFRLRVRDNAGAINDDVARVLVNSASTNQPPVANAGPDKVITLPVNSLSISGDGSDNDGQVTGYLWEKTIGGEAIFSNPSNKNLSVSNLVEGQYVFRLTVTDNIGASDFDEMNLRVLPLNSNLPPVINMGDVTLFLPLASYLIEPNVEDADGTVSTFFWSKVGGPGVNLVNQNAKNLEIQNFVEGVYTFRLTVIDDKNTSSSAQVKVTVLSGGINKSPVVSAGINRTITLPVNSITLTGTATDADGSIVSLLWTKNSGGTFSITNETTLTPTFSDLQEGTYVFKLTATDNQGAVASSNVRIVVNPVPPNQKPIVNAGTNQSYELPLTSIDLIGTANDPDGSVASVEWSQVEGASSAIIENKNTLNATVKNLDIGTYIFRLTATDNLGAKGFSEVIIFISDPTSTEGTPPVVYAGDDVVLVIPDNSISITGNALDPDGFVSNYIWTQVSGNPVTFTFDEHILHVSDLEAGMYVFRLTAIDLDELSGFDEVLIAVVEENNEIPKFFSPNNDGIGDVWTFRNPDKYSDCTIKVFSRAGREVYSAAPYNNNWNGLGKNGQSIEDGDYYYILLCADGRQIKGAVRVIR